MKSAFEQILGGKRKRVVSADELPSPRQPRVTIESPTRSTLQPLTVETFSSSPIQSASESHRTPSPNSSAATTSQPSLRERLFPNGETYGLRVLHEPAEPFVDIIFVHGLTGDSYNTWLEAESGTYWPVHLLSKDVPDARILAFGYDADVTKFLGPVSQNNLHDHAAALLGELAAVRLNDDSHRKIVFVVHSLGGLVTKRALCLSEWAFEPHLKQMDRCTIAVAFLGTPHHGSNLTPFASTVANILNISGKRVNKQILQLLNRNSEVLADVEESYGVWLQRNRSRFSLTCFFEELELPAVGMVVAKESAKLSGYPQLSIHANHMGMTKFSSATDAGYRRIRGEVKRWLRPLRTQPETTIRLTQDEQGCLRSLAFPQMNDRSNDIVPPADGTCTWLPEHPIYKDWISQRQGLLWIKGKPGAGKSTLLKHGLLTPTNEPPSRIPLTISFFFHGRGAEIQKTPLGLYRSLLYQLLERFPKALSNVVQTFKSNCAGKGMPGEKWNWHVQELRDFVESSLAKILQESAIRIFVDALDECGEEEARRLVRSFEHLHSKTYSTSHGLSICFSCRHWPVIAPDNCQEICAEHENREDIRTYIQEELQSVVLDPEERATLQDKIEARSECVFQWVVLVMARIVGMCRDGKTLRQCLEVLKEIPQDLNDLYEDIIQRLMKENRGQSMKLFQWICFALRPLSIAELRCAMNVDANPAYQSFQDCKKLPGYIETDTQMEKQLRSLSGGLAEWKYHEDQRATQLVHQSVNDYLISKGFYRFDNSLDSVDKIVGCSQSRLSRSCIVYFAMDEIKRRQRRLEMVLLGDPYSYESEDLISRVQAAYPFLGYAIESWLSHAEIAEEQGMPQEDILPYLQSWIMLCWVGLDQIFTHSHPMFPTGTTTLHVASAYNLSSLVSAILNNVERYNLTACSKDRLGWTPLSWAASKGHEGIVKLLLGQPNVEADSKDRNGQTPLSKTAEYGHEAVVKLLLAHPDIEADSKDKYGRTPLSWTTEGGYNAVVKLLLAQPNVAADSKDVWGQTPLSWAARRGHENVVKLLLARPDVDVDSMDNSWGQTSLSWAAENGHEAVVELLLAQPNVDANSKDNRMLRTPLSWAARNGHEAVVKLLLAQPDVDINSEDLNDETPLFHAAEEGQEGVIKLLLAHPDIDINSKDHDGDTPLIVATIRGHDAVIDLLLAHPDIDINSKDVNGWTPLKWATRKEHEGVIKLLQSKGALSG